MSWIDTLHQLTNNVGRGALDVFTLGGNELGHQFGGQGYKNILKPVETGMGANFEAGAAGGSGMLGLQGMGAFGAGAGAGAPTAGVGGMTTASGAQGMGQGMAAPAAAAPSPVSQALQMMRGMPMGGGQQQQAPPQQDIVAKIYQMYPQLRPHFGGTYGSR